MPPSVEDRLRDILEAIVEIDTMLAGMSLEQFSADNMRRMATERYLEIVCDAARNLRSGQTGHVGHRLAQDERFCQLVASRLSRNQS